MCFQFLPSGSIDCMHVAWKNCPKAWAGQFQGKEGHPTVVLEAVADKQTWIWYSYFGRFKIDSNDILIVLINSFLSNLLYY